LGNIDGVTCLPKSAAPVGAVARLAEASQGKDTTIGHWEIAGVVSEAPLPTYPEGFPPEIMEPFCRATGRGYLANKPWSGTAVIEAFGEEHMKTGDLIVYTSADSVLQICGNEETFDLAELYRCCEIAREITLKDEWRVGRIIARPYVGKKKGEFTRTSNRHDYALKPFAKTALNVLKENNFDVISVGKINDIFDGEGITESNKSKSSVHGMEQTIEIAQKEFNGLCFVNLVDFDANWGHRRNPVGYAEEIEKFDVNLGKLMDVLTEDDLLIITADHGNDPTYTGTDHTREKVPFIAYSKAMKGSGKLDTIESFGAIGATICENFGLQMPEGTVGKSVLQKLN
jgi:phosphopentomutase